MRLDRLEESVLPLVSKPGRYLAPAGIGGITDFDSALATVCIVNTAPWEAGMGAPRLHTLFHALSSHSGVVVDLAFSPDEDFEQCLAERGLPLFGLRSRRAFADFDLLLVLPHQLSAVGRLSRLLELGGIPPAAADRGSDHPVVLIGGPATSWPGPLAEVADGLLAGDPEAFVDDLIELCRREGSSSREARLFRLSDLDGVHMLHPVPGEAEPRRSPQDVVPRWMDRFPDQGADSLVPLGEGGAILEIARNPGLFRPFDQTVREVVHLAASTGCGEVVLAGEGVGRYPELAHLLEVLNQGLSPHDVNVGITEVDPTHWGSALARELRKAHRSELVFTPVAPSERLREAHGPALSNADLLKAFEIARRGKWSHVRVQVLLGLPGEEEADLREWSGFLEDLLTAMKSGSSSPKVTIAAVPYAFPRYPADPGRDWAAHLRVVGDWQKRFRRRRLRVVDHLIEQAITEAISVQGLFPNGHDHGWSWVEAAHSRPLSDIDSPSVPDAGDHPSRDFGVPAWAGGRRPRRASRGREIRQADRFRLRFSKDEPLRFSSHLDVTRAFRRAFRMSQLPVARSGGKDRRPKVSFGPPLPLGMTSGAEFLDVTFQREMPESFVRSLNQSLVEGLTVVACAPVRTEPDSLNSAIQIASYEVSFSDTVIEEYLGGIEFDDLKTRLEEMLAEVLASNEFLVTKVRGEVSRTFNARPSLRRADVVRDDGGRPALSMQLTLNRPDSVRPELLTATLVNWAKIDERLFRVHRSGLHIPGRNKDLDPLEVVAPGFRWWRQQVRRGTVL